MNTKNKFTIAASVAALMLSAAAFAQQGGTAQEAKAMHSLTRGRSRKAKSLK
jgi:hypothetical protein